jgi:glycosyltransferase involved in cell wall biosynthesis
MQMKISGFTMGKNARKLYYPMKQAIQSILPLVDEFIVVLGDSDSDDTTRQEIESIHSDKIRIYQTVWDIEKYPRGMEHAHQTDIAKSYCTGDWLFYLQSDEVVHEDDLPVIRKRCEELLDDTEVEGLLFDYIHFWGDFNHYQNNHCWYRKEIRIVRNRPDIHSWESAQSFRRIPDFDGIHYRQKENTFKLKVAEAHARIFHYGWVRPPELMNSKIKSFSINHRGVKTVNEMEKKELFRGYFDYGNLNKVPAYKGTHPAVMIGWISQSNWQDNLRFQGVRRSLNKMVSKHDRTRYVILSWIERNLLFGARLGEFKNYIRVKR